MRKAITANREAKSKQIRNSNIELLRIISMLMIVLSHYTVHNGVSNASLQLGANRFLLEIATLGNIGVIIFIMITGYYLGHNDKPLQWKKLAKIILEVLFYSVGIYLILLAFGIINFDWKEALKSFLPITFKSYWFATAYVVLYIFHPYINKMLNNLSRKEELRLIFCGLVVFSILHTLTTKDFYGNEIIQFILFYIIGDYLGRHKGNRLNIRKYRVLLLIISAAVLIASVVVFDLLGQKVSFANTHSIYLFSRTSPVAIAFAVSLFACFAYRKVFYSKAINFIAKMAFGVYLISDNMYIRDILWFDVLNNKEYINSGFLFLHIIISVVCVYIICTAVDAVRYLIIENTISNRLD